jgi:hypothetical protein
MNAIPDTGAMRTTTRDATAIVAPTPTAPVHYAAIGIAASFFAPSARSFSISSDVICTASIGQAESGFLAEAYRYNRIEQAADFPCFSQRFRGRARLSQAVNGG